jgi:hypothetical protein
VAQSARASAAGVLKLYERWLKHGSSDIAATLGAHGLVPLRGGGGVH